ncbi:hypothetical protein HPB49_010573 [Dermacentor silvarum]|uniref:Uncharacterized protein n=1 Tax=Dermacentor silvarum TaxID=543639 RepID=A0ACB8DP75_DERSI|nr:hypothetical protein HPB49_010573 [Dermacentor silvarum]
MEAVPATGVTRLRFTEKDDLALLREVNACNTLRYPSKWQEIAKNMELATKKVFSGRTPRERWKLLLANFAKNDRACLRKDTFQPDAVVLVGHLSSRRSEEETCEILAPTTLVHFARHASPSLRDAHDTVRKLDSRGIRAALFVSLAMFGRWYKPRYQNPESRARSGSLRGFGFLQKCRHDSGDVLGSHVQVCRDSAYTIAYHKEEPQGAVAYYRGAGKLLAYDNPESLRRKLCAARSNVTAVKYGFTAFNVEYEDATNRCGEGSFSRLRALKDLLNAFARRDSSEEAEEC